MSISGVLAPPMRPALLGCFWGLLAVLFGYVGWLDDASATSEDMAFVRVLAVIAALVSAGLLYLSRRVRAVVDGMRSGPAAQIYLAPDGRTARVATAPWLWSLTFSGLNFIPHRRALLGVLVFVGSQVTLGLAALVAALFARSIVESGYRQTGWQQL